MTKKVVMICGMPAGRYIHGLAKTFEAADIYELSVPLRGKGKGERIRRRKQWNRK